MTIGYSAVAAVYLGALAIRTSYELLKKAGRLDPRSHALFAVILDEMADGPQYPGGLACFCL
jgi:hypothetical protein